jgi:hypothetical protein
MWSKAGPWGVFLLVASALGARSESVTSLEDETLASPYVQEATAKSVPEVSRDQGLQLLVAGHRRELQTSVSTSAGLTSALANTTVGHIVLAPGTYAIRTTLRVTRSVIIEAAVRATVVLDAQTTNYMNCNNRVLDINPGSSGVVQLIGLNITGGCSGGWDMSYDAGLDSSVSAPNLQGGGFLLHYDVFTCFAFL